MYDQSANGFHRSFTEKYAQKYVNKNSMLQCFQFSKR